MQISDRLIQAPVNGLSQRLPLRSCPEETRVAVTFLNYRRDDIVKDHLGALDEDDLARHGDGGPFGLQFRSGQIAQTRDLDAIEQDTVGAQQTSDASGTVIRDIFSELQALFIKDRREISTLHDPQRRPLRLELERRHLETT